MAQAGFTPFSLYSSSTASAAPTAGNLAAGELAINTADGKLFYKDNLNAVQIIGYKNVPLNTVTGTLAVANGGTGQTTYTDGQLLIGNSTGNTLTKTTLTAGSGITITNGSGAITIAASGGGGGTVTSVSGAGTVNGLSLTGTVTTTGSLTLGGTFRYNVQVVGVNTAATANNVYVLTAGSITITLPATPTAGDIVGFSNMSGATNIVVARNGSNIMALAQDLTIDQDGAGFLLVYADATRGWVLMP